MRIKQGLNPMLAEIGKIKIGGKGDTRNKKGGGTYQLPIRYDSFKITTTMKDPKTGNFIIDDNLMATLPNNPTEIPIRLPFDDIEMNFRTCFEYYAGKKCICRGDGEKAIYTDDKGKQKEITCKNQDCGYLKNGKCKVAGILSCFISNSSDFGGVHRFRTHGWNSVSNILASLEFIAENTGGILQNLPLKLKMLKKSTAEHGDVNTVTILLDGLEMSRLRELAITEKNNRAALNYDIKAVEKKAITAGFLKSTDDEKDIADEFYPDEIEPPKTVSDDELADAIIDDIPNVNDTPEYVKPTAKPVVIGEKKKGEELDLF